MHIYIYSHAQILMNLTRVSYTPPYTHIPPTSATCLSDSHGSAPMAHIRAYIHIYIHTRVPPTSATRHKHIDLYLYTRIPPTSAPRLRDSHGAALSQKTVTTHESLGDSSLSPDTSALTTVVRLAKEVSISYP